MALKDYVRDLLAKPAELAALRDALAAAPPTPKASTALPPDEFAAIARAQRARIVKYHDRAGRFAAERAVADEKVEKATREHFALTEGHRQETFAFTAARDAAAHLLIAGCPFVPLVESKVAALKAEAERLKADGYQLEARVAGVGSGVGQVGEGEIVPDGVSILDDARTISNGPSVAARQKALRELVELVENWVWTGQVPTVEAFEATFAEAYAKLPKVEALANLMRKDPRGRQFVAEVVKRERLAVA